MSNYAHSIGITRKNVFAAFFAPDMRVHKFAIDFHLNGQIKIIKSGKANSGQHAQIQKITVDINRRKIDC